MMKKLIAAILSVVIFSSSFSPAVYAAEETGLVQEEAAELKIKAKQTTLSLAATGNLKVFKSAYGGKMVLSVKKPAGAGIANIAVLDTKATTVPQGALSYVVQENSNGTYTVSYRIEDAAKLKDNANYKPAFAVTPKGNAVNKAAQTISVSLKIKR